jgi:citrate lyase subunit beta/citryl-CoA lyase
MRSYLVVPGDDPELISQGAASGADALILDLANPASVERRAAARAMVARFLRERAGRPGLSLLVRVNGFESGLTDDDLDAVMPGAPHGVVLPRSSGGADVTRLGAKLAVREAEFGLEDGATRIIAEATGTPRAVFGLGTYAGASRRLSALAWSARGLAMELGALTPLTPAGVLSDPLQLARGLCLFGAAAAGVAAIDAPHDDVDNAAGLGEAVEEARRDGFTGKLAIHPAQIEAINRGFSPAAGKTG